MNRAQCSFADCSAKVVDSWEAMFCESPVRLLLCEEHADGLSQGLIAPLDVVITAYATKTAEEVSESDDVEAEGEEEVRAEDITLRQEAQRVLDTVREAREKGTALDEVARRFKTVPGEH